MFTRASRAMDERLGASPPQLSGLPRRKPGAPRWRDLGACPEHRERRDVWSAKRTTLGRPRRLDRHQHCHAPDPCRQEKLPHLKPPIALVDALDSATPLCSVAVIDVLKLLASAKPEERGLGPQHTVVDQELTLR